METAIARLERQILDQLIEQFEVPAEVTTETNFELLDFDSLTMVEFSLVLGKMFGVELDDDELKEAGSAAGVAALLVSRGVTG